ncbi:MAG: molybdopterin nucleotidyltransferase and molybdopterin-guanine dinucleotide biosynthesis protein [Dehalococcoidia bacterium]|nr:molybdopterin nucleotidyltransferase and molybdopterin-guanine dinucleotide biosynthesis protein [Dehalococcoidia bacterium]
MDSIVLAGGKSRRMGKDKLAETIGGRSLLQRVVDTLLPLSREVIVVTHQQRYDLPLSPHPRVRIAEDLLPDAGPLGGIYTGLTLSSSPYAYVVAGDMPFINPALLLHMADLREGNQAVAITSGGEPQPLHAIYARSCLPAVESMVLPSGRMERRLKLTDLLAEVNSRFLDEKEYKLLDPFGLSAYNVNTPESLSLARSFLGRMVERGHDVPTPPVVCFVGRSGSGKTSFLEALLPELKRRGYEVGVIKHSHHPLQLDQPGKDSWRFAQAGSRVVAASSQGSFGLMERPIRELSLGEIVHLMEGKVDIILAEGYKGSGAPKIEVVRNEGDLQCEEEELLAIVTSQPASGGSVGVPTYSFDDVAGVADLIIGQVASNLPRR